MRTTLRDPGVACRVGGCTVRTLAVVATVLLVVSSSLIAGEPGKGRPSGPPPGEGGPGGGHGFGFDMRKWENIELSDSQKKRLLDAMTSHFRASQEVLLSQMEEHRKQGKSGRNAPPSGKPDNEKLQSLKRQLRKEIESILTPEQLKQLDSTADSRRPPPEKGDRSTPQKRK